MTKFVPPFKPILSVPMTKSNLQIERSKYLPKLPAALRGAIKVNEGEKTKSIADQESIEKIFPKTYGMPLITFEVGDQDSKMPSTNVGVILSGGQLQEVIM